MLIRTIKPHRTRATLPFVRWTSQAAVPAKEIAIIGGGIAGLSAAFFLQRSLPHARITLIEQSERAGGWVQSKQFFTTDKKHVIFEEGPRSLRPAGLPGLNTLDLIRQLGIEDKMILVSKTSASARNRFIYYAGRVHKLPASLLGFIRFALQNPILKGSLTSLCMEPFRRRPKELQDETIASFISRRFSPILANNMLSAVVHGIYSGSIDRLSVRSTFRALWEYESKAGSVVAGLLRGTQTMTAGDQKLQDQLTQDNSELVTKMKDISVYSFQGGLSTLTNAIIAKLERCETFAFRLKTSVLSISRDQDKFIVKLASGSDKSESAVFDNVISSVKAKTLFDALESTDLKELQQIEYSTVMVINFYYKSADVLPIEGFGYLIPKSVPLEENPDRALGVVFDSSSIPGQDGTVGTKITCIMGGHFWSDLSPEQLPSEQAGYEATKKVMSMHLGVDVEPEFWNAKLQKDCIPQYTVGHISRMQSLHAKLAEDYTGLGLVGSSYGGVSINDCILNARKIATSISRAGRATGLEDFLDQDPSISGR